MNHLNKKKTISYKDLIYKLLLFIATVAVIVYFLPREGKFNYQLDVDKPWKYGQLMATFDFPIYKDKSTVTREQDSLNRSFQPYFNLDKKIEINVLKNLRDNYNQSLKFVIPNHEYYKYIEHTLKTIYSESSSQCSELRHSLSL